MIDANGLDPRVARCATRLIAWRDDLPEGTAVFVAELLRQAGDRRSLLFQDLEREEEQPDAPKLITGRQLMSIQPTPMDWLVDTLIPSGRQGMIYGPPGGWKSQMCRALGGGLAVGASDVFGRLAARPGRTLFLTAEETWDDIRMGMSITAAGGGYDLGTVLDNTRFGSFREAAMFLRDDSARLALETWIDDERPSLVVLDALSSLSGLDLKVDTEMSPLLQWGARMSSAHSTTVLWIGHDKKDREASDLESLFGSRQNAALLDFAYRVKPQGRDRMKLVCVKMRGAAPPHDLNFDVVVVNDEEIGFSIVDEPGEQDMDPEKVSRIADAIRNVLTMTPGLSATGIRKAIAGGRGASFRPNDIQRVRDMLEEDGRIENKGEGASHAWHWCSEW